MLNRVHAVAQGNVSSQEAAKLLGKDQLQESDLVPGQYEGVLLMPALVLAGLRYSQAVGLHTCRVIAHVAHGVK